MIPAGMRQEEFPVRITQRFVPVAISLALASMVAGCSSTPQRSSSVSYGTSVKADPRCRVASACAYNGPYEPGERDYAEQEAARLNQAEYERLSRMK
jgi:hypothetical protein